MDRLVEIVMGKCSIIGKNLIGENYEIRNHMITLKHNQEPLYNLFQRTNKLIFHI